MPELRGCGDGSWREVAEPPWRLVYRVIGSVVEIHGVFDVRRHFDDVLRERMLLNR